MNLTERTRALIYRITLAASVVALVVLVVVADGDVDRVVAGAITLATVATNALAVMNTAFSKTDLPDGDAIR